MYTLEKAIQDYKAEIDFLKELKTKGETEVSLTINGEKIDIDEAINDWQQKLDTLKLGNINPELYNY